MIQATDTGRPGRTVRWSMTRLEYPVASVVVGVARNQDDRDSTRRDEDGAAR